MDFYSLLKNQSREYKELLKREGVKGRYTRITLDLSASQTRQELHIEGDYIGVASITSTGTVKIRLDHRHSQEIDLREVSEISSPFGKLYFTTDGGGGEAIIYVGGALTARLKPLQSKVSIRNIGGSDVDLVTDSRFIAHTGGHEKTTLSVADTREEMVAAALKVKWAMIYTDLAFRYTMDNTCARATAIGAVVAAGGTLTLEYVDLRTIFFVNDVAAETPAINIEYIEEV